MKFCMQNEIIMFSDRCAFSHFFFLQKISRTHRLIYYICFLLFFSNLKPMNEYYATWVCVCSKNMCPHIKLFSMQNRTMCQMAFIWRSSRVIYSLFEIAWQLIVFYCINWSDRSIYICTNMQCAHYTVHVHGIQMWEEEEEKIPSFLLIFEQITEINI